MFSGDTITSLEQMVAQVQARHQNIVPLKQVGGDGLPCNCMSHLVQLHGVICCSSCGATFVESGK